MSEFKPGEIVDITIKGARIEWANSTDMNVWAVDEVDPDTGVNLGEQITISHTAENITVERVAPAEWPPRPGDLWRDHDGDVWFCRAWQAEDKWRTGLVCARRVPGKSAILGGSMSAAQVQDRHGPLTFVHREDES